MVCKIVFKNYEEYNSQFFLRTLLYRQSAKEEVRSTEIKNELYCFTACQLLCGKSDEENYDVNVLLSEKYTRCNDVLFSKGHLTYQALITFANAFKSDWCKMQFSESWTVKRL